MYLTLLILIGGGLLYGALAFGALASPLAVWRHYQARGKAAPLYPLVIRPLLWLAGLFAIGYKFMLAFGGAGILIIVLPSLIGGAVLGMLGVWPFRALFNFHRAYLVEASASGEPASLETLKPRLESAGLGQYWPTIAAELRPAIYLRTLEVSDESIPVGTSKLGGRPDLPKGTAWPTGHEDQPFAFLAQINCAEAATHDEEHILPTTGLLSFFYQPDDRYLDLAHWNPKNVRVLYTESAKLSRLEFPASLPDGSDDIEWESHRFPAAKVSFIDGQSLPSYYGDLKPRLKPAVTDEQSEAFAEIYEPTRLALSPTNTTETYLLGHAEVLQESDGREFAEIAFNPKVFGTKHRSPLPKGDWVKARSLAATHKWRLLFQLSSHQDLKMMWGDVGYLFFLIREDDLKAKRFDRVWCELATG